jgi:hypothetical protein
MKQILLKIPEEESDNFQALMKFYRAKNNAGYGTFSCLAGETFPDGWIKAFDNGWNEKGIYGDNFRKTFGL